MVDGAAGASGLYLHTEGFEYKDVYRTDFVVKIFLNFIKELLTPLSLAYWMCDDGSFDKENRAVRLCTHSFSLEEVNLLINVLETKWNLKCTINKGSGQFIIRISPPGSLIYDRRHSGGT
jgi:LAGLIDADG DNA endonuclease family